MPHLCNPVTLSAPTDDRSTPSVVGSLGHQCASLDRVSNFADPAPPQPNKQLPLPKCYQLPSSGSHVSRKIATPAAAAATAAAVEAAASASESDSDDGPSAAQGAGHAQVPAQEPGRQPHRAQDQGVAAARRGPARAPALRARGRLVSGHGAGEALATAITVPVLLEIMRPSDSAEIIICTALCDPRAHVATTTERGSKLHVCTVKRSNSPSPPPSHLSPHSTSAVRTCSRIFCS
ncbi:unnamed protein product [Phytophthora fragariaefolia]|uniref:Unnamed protein product n=1 Tax=Phytophthora fragariaefolia TaxID=1490495 RepID=A0A9W7D9X5_9STRA|nr:unnamed protein product [Phytophthora fragariaefolia]